MLSVRPENLDLFADPGHGPINVTLSKLERRTADTLAQARQAWCIKNHVHDQKKAADMTGILITEEGTAAEWAFAKAFNLCPDMTVGQFAKFDFILTSGLRVDVKQSGRDKGNLVVKESTKRNGADLFALVLGKGYSFQIWGYAWVGDLLDPSNLAPWLPVPGFLIPRADLFDPRDLRNPDPAAIKAKRLTRKASEAVQAQRRLAQPQLTSPAPA